jgi:pimeloyl-ACP methyl ester carboxylesterase/DNA-binding CsgD family transcriptional regulator
MEAPPVQYVQTRDGFSIAYGVAGEGIPLVRVPSMYGHFSLQWDRGILDREFRALSENFQAVLFDCRGQGSSTRGLSGTTSVEDYVRDLEQLVEHLGLRKAVLLGLSAMGKIAVRYAVEHPDRVMALVLNHYRDVHRGTRTAIFEMAKSDWSLHIQSDARLGWTWADPATVVPVLRDSISQEDFLQEFLAMSAEPGDEMLARLEVPVLVMATRDASSGRPMGGEEDAKRIASIIPGARLVLFDDIYGGFNPDDGLPPAIAAIQSLLTDLQPEAQPASLPQHSAGLSAREIEVLGLLAMGKSNAQIAAELVISPNTVNRHVSNIYAKTGAANRAEAASYATRNGIA